MIAAEPPEFQAAASQSAIVCGAAGRGGVRRIRPASASAALTWISFVVAAKPWSDTMQTMALGSAARIAVSISATIASIASSTRNGLGAVRPGVVLDVIEAGHVDGQEAHLLPADHRHRVARARLVAGNRVVEVVGVAAGDRLEIAEQPRRRDGPHQLDFLGRLHRPPVLGNVPVDPRRGRR